MGTVSFDQVRARRSSSVWTRVHPIFALGQLGAFFVSVLLLAGYFAGWVSYAAVFESVLVKIAFMIGAIVTGAFWERDVYGHYWFAPEFFFEDAMTVNVFLLHLGFLAVAYSQPNMPEKSLVMLGIAYLVYVANVAQYILRTHKMSQQAVAVRTRS
jgi:3-vinyl bacteriochlorophyllide hydratase